MGQLLETSETVEAQRVDRLRFDQWKLREEIHAEGTAFRIHHTNYLGTRGRMQYFSCFRSGKTVRRITARFLSGALPGENCRFWWAASSSVEGCFLRIIDLKLITSARCPPIIFLIFAQTGQNNFLLICCVNDTTSECFR